MSPVRNVTAEMARRAWNLFGPQATPPQGRQILGEVNHTALRNILHVCMDAAIPEQVYILLEYLEGKGTIPRDARDLLAREMKAVADTVPPDADDRDRRQMEVIRAFVGQVVRLHRAVQSR